MNKKELNTVSEVLNTLNEDKDFTQFEQALACLDKSEKSLQILESQLFNITVKCAVEFITRGQLVLIGKVISRLDSNELTKKAYVGKLLKAFSILTGTFKRDSNGDLWFDKENFTVAYSKKEKLFFKRVDREENFIKERLEESKTLINVDWFKSFRELYNLKSYKVDVDYTTGFLKALKNIDKNASKVKGKNKHAINELLEFARSLKLLPEKEAIDLLHTGQARHNGTAVKKVA